MKRLSLGVLMAAWVTVAVLTSCQANNPMGASSAPGPTATPVPTVTPGGPTPTPTPITVGAAGTSFSPSTLSIPAGTTVNWAASLGGHTVDMDNGAGVCSSDLTTFPNSTLFSTPGTYHVHCDIHSPCGAGSCSGCTGMVMTITVI